MASGGFRPLVMFGIIASILVLTGAVIYFNLVMHFIIVMMLVVMGSVMFFGSQHDPHTNVRSVESSRAVQTLREQDERASKKLQSKTEGEEA